MRLCGSIFQEVKVSHGGQKVDETLMDKCQVSWAKRSGRSGGTALVYGNDRQRRAEWDIESDGTKSMRGLDLRVTE